ncbi:hypothetical protein ACIREO_05435 [Streptomyces sp. NPDC102441]|uniref:hypothetical protein n=1 Tax=Streptomyces sp. NPDC102441 TaxID=3366176 RepID=UPI00380741E7
MTADQTSTPVDVTLVSGPSGAGSIDDFELFYARRALRLFKARLGREKLLDLLAKDIEEGNAALRESALASGGRFTGGTTVLATKGLKAGEFMAWMGEAFDDQSVLLEAHPEHYVMGNRTDGTVHIVENVGPHISDFSMGSWSAEAMDWAEDAAELLPEAEFPYKRASNLFLADGTIVGRVLIQFGDTADGFTSNLTVYLPASCPEDVLEHHLRHFAVEFRNWIEVAGPAQS